MNAVILWLAARLASAVGGWIAGYFSAPVCPADPSSFMCSHWTTLAAIAAAVLGPFGFKVARSAVAQKRDGLRVVRLDPPRPPGRSTQEDPSSDPVAPASSNLDQSPVTLDDPSARGG